MHTVLKYLVNLAFFTACGLGYGQATKATVPAPIRVAPIPTWSITMGNQIELGFHFAAAAPPQSCRVLYPGGHYVNWHDCHYHGPSACGGDSVCFCNRDERIGYYHCTEGSFVQCEMRNEYPCH